MQPPPQHHLAGIVYFGGCLWDGPRWSGGPTYRYPSIRRFGESVAFSFSPDTGHVRVQIRVSNRSFMSRDLETPKVTDTQKATSIVYITRRSGGRRRRSERRLIDCTTSFFFLFTVMIYTRLRRRTVSSCPVRLARQALVRATRKATGEAGKRRT